VAEPLRILILEDNPADAELVQFELEEAGIFFAAKVVMTEKDFIQEMQIYCPDLILSDYDLPKYNGALALAEARRRCPDTPFILVTGAVTEDRAIEILTQGAKDYVLKSRLEQRLAPAVRRALAEAREHRERKKAEEELQAASLYARTLIEASLDPLVTISPEGKVMDVNKATEEITGVSRERIIGNDFSDYFTEPEKARAGYKKVFSEGSVKDYPLAIRHVTGGVTEVLYNATTYRNEKGEVQGVFAAARDVTERKKAEGELHEAHRTLERQVAERTSELQESRQRLSLALTSSGMGTFEWDIAENRRHFDDYVCCLFGINPEAFTGTAEEFFRVIHPDDRKAVQDALNEAAEQDKPYESEYRAVWPDGSIHHITARGKVLRDAAGRQLRMIGVCWEITERKRAENSLRESESRLRRIYESGLLGVIHWNMDGAITNANDKFLEIVGYGRDDLAAGRIDWGRMTPPEYRHLDEESGKELKATGVNKEPFEKEYIRKDGTRVPVIVAGAMLDEARFNGVAIVLDIIERKRMEKALKQRSDQLEAANRELENFSYSVSHDLKAPLRAIEGYSRRLVEKYKPALDGGAARMIDVIHGETQKMEGLIDDLLSYSKVLSNGMTWSEIAMDKLAGEVWNDVRAAHRGREIEARITKLLPGFGDRALVRHVLLNLLSNAVKFTKNRAPGIIELSSYAEPGRVVYCVKDNGIGFDMAYADKLFGLFHRLHDREEYAGTGVGLAIVRRVIDRHGGRVWAEGIPDKGATFYFSLPTDIGTRA
jgi:PAS domain S-box-containing protein